MNCQECECHALKGIYISNPLSLTQFFRTIQCSRRLSKVQFPVKKFNYYYRVFFMPTTKKQKSKARKSKEADVLSDIENLDIMFGSNHLEREESNFSNSVHRPECPRYNALVNHDVSSHSNSRD